MLSNSKPHSFALLGLALSVVLLLAVNIFSNASFKGLQLDFTEGSLFTLSDGTRAVLKDLDEPIKVQLFFSENLGEQSPPHATYFKRVKELLDQYVNISEGKIELSVYNPEPFSDHEDLAVAVGLKGVPINRDGDFGYFGLAAYNSTDDTALIGFLSPDRETFLEYDITKLIHSIAKPKTVTIGLLSSLPLMGGSGPRTGQQPRWAVVDQIREFFDVLPLSDSMTKIPDGVDILMIVHPKGLSPELQYSIDQFVLSGGRALVFVDSNAEMMANPNDPVGAAMVSDFDNLLQAWGVKMSPDAVAGDLKTARRVNVQVTRDRTAASNYVAWLGLTPENMAQNDVVTGELQVLNIATAGILEPVEGAATTLTPLLETSPQSMAIDRKKLVPSPDVLGLLQTFKAENRKLTLAARVSGKARTAFPDGPPENVETPQDHKPLKESATGINVIVVSDSDLLRDRMWVERQNIFGNQSLVPHANNGDFVINAIDNLSGSDALIDLRARNRAQRPFHLVEDIRREAELEFRSKEKELQDKLADVKGKLDSLLRREGAASGAVVMTAEEEDTVNKFRLEMSAIRKELRNVQLALRQDIDKLDSLIKFINIGAIPLTLLIISIIAGTRRNTRRRAVETD